jgi:hypothetical protein
LTSNFNLKDQNIISLSNIAFYGIAGLILLILSGLSGFPPHVALLGITSLIVAYGLFKKRAWSVWLVIALFFVITGFSIYTLIFVLSTDIVASIAFIAYLLLTWVFTAYSISQRRKK